MVHRQSNETNDEIIFSVGFSTGANHNVNNWPKWFLFPYREGWAGLSKDSYYSNDDAAAIPTKYAYLMYDWLKDRRASVTFMSPVMVIQKHRPMVGIQVKIGFSVLVLLREFLKRVILSFIFQCQLMENLNIGLKQTKMQ